MDNIDKNDIFKEIELIQSCISRMASNSFAMKGWHIGIISALIVFFFSKDTVNYHALFIVIAAVTLIFWYLDSYYLMLERKYRWKYQWVLKNRVNSTTICNMFFLNLNPDKSEMWDADQNSKGYKSAIKTLNCMKQHKKALVCSFYHFKEVGIVMLSNTMEAEYMLVFIASIIAEIVNIYCCFHCCK